jgi:hypothetical protein
VIVVFAGVIALLALMMDQRRQDYALQVAACFVKLAGVVVGVGSARSAVRNEALDRALHGREGFDASCSGCLLALEEPVVARALGFDELAVERCWRRCSPDRRGLTPCSGPTCCPAAKSAWT